MNEITEKKVKSKKSFRNKLVAMFSMMMIMLASTTNLVFATTPTPTAVNFDEYSGIFDFIVSGVTKVCSIFTVFPINIMLACGLLGIAVALIKKFAPGKKM